MSTKYASILIVLMLGVLSAFRKKRSLIAAGVENCYASNVFILHCTQTTVRITCHQYKIEFYPSKIFSLPNLRQKIK